MDRIVVGLLLLLFVRPSYSEDLPKEALENMQKEHQKYFEAEKNFDAKTIVEFSPPQWIEKVGKEEELARFQKEVDRAKKEGVKLISVKDLPPSSVAKSKEGWFVIFSSTVTLEIKKEQFKREWITVGFSPNRKNWYFLPTAVGDTEDAFKEMFKTVPEGLKFPSK